jgi:hypothetical protein
VAYKLAQLVIEALFLQPQFCRQINAPSMSLRGRECRSNLYRERLMRLLRFARNDSKGWLAMTVSVTSPTKVKQILPGFLLCRQARVWYDFKEKPGALERRGLSPSSGEKA